jgi:hypothetical protein
MKNIVRLTESELNILIKDIIKEQVGLDRFKPKQKVNPFSDKIESLKKKYPCIPPAFIPAIHSLIKKGYDKFLLKIALGVVGRESSFGSGLRYSILEPFKELSHIFSDSSIGPAQMTKETIKSLKIKENVLTIEGALIAVYTYIKKAIDIAKKNGYSENSKSVNMKPSNSINAVLDIAVASYNLGFDKITKYCETSNPKIKKPCSEAGKTINNVKLTNKWVKNYLPNYNTKRWDKIDITSHGYVTEVANKIKKINCF